MILSELRKPKDLRARQAVDRVPPFGERGRVGPMRARPPQPHHILEHMGAIADDAEVSLDVLVDRRRIDVDVNFLRSWRERVEAPGDAIVEARADANHQVAIVHGVVGLERSMHAKHAEPMLVGSRKGAEPQERRGDRESGRADEFAQQGRGVGAGIDDSAAGVENRLLRRRHHLHRVGDPLQIALDLRMIGLVLDVPVDRIGAAGELHVFRDVDDDRSRAAVRGDVERLVQDAGQVFDPAHQIIVLGATAGDAGGVALLERVRADEMGRHLAGDADQRDRIEQRVGQAGDRVGGAGTGRDQQNADLAGRAGVALGRVGRALLMAHENVPQLVLIEDRVVDRQHRAARIAEHDVDALILQRLDHHLRAGHVPGHNRCSPLSRRTLWPSFREFKATKKAPRGPWVMRQGTDRAYARLLSSAKVTIRNAMPRRLD